ncbi:FHA domain-containing protein [Archangium violaceum]|uniref:FHA domain-containing protein n=1 Tax=Archangium violaceum TaxID=83451 RepID=UPI00193C5AB1|nr:FHA domain-containing protein [Archangium violaceum]QRK07552.1 FHA domain-containing protein [Archangium violaceum]
MIDQNSRPARKVGIADHLWETYEDMAQQMGSDRDALINQALFMFARLNGFIEVARPGRSEAPGMGVASRAAAPAPAPAAARSAPPVLQPVSGGAPARSPPPALRDDTPLPAPAPQRPSARLEERPPANALDNDPARREVAERVLETAAELERLIKGKSSEPREELDEEPLPEDSDDPGMDMAAHDEPMADDEPLPEDEPMDEEPMDEPGGSALILTMDNAEPQTITKERFVIGRGKHCDLMINSGKVSREHAVIVREGDDFFIEDLGSSNGTWFNKQRIKRRKIEDGDEYFICSERVRLSYA